MKIHKVKSARKRHYCENCGEPIEIGESYIWWQPIGFNPVKWHVYHGKPPKYMLTSSQNKKTVYTAQERMISFLRVARKMIYDVEPEDEIKGYLLSGRKMIYYLVKISNSTAKDYIDSGEHIEHRYGKNSVVCDCYKRADKLVTWAEELSEILYTWDDVIDSLFSCGNVYENLMEYINDCEDAIYSLDF